MPTATLDPTEARRPATLGPAPVRPGTAGPAAYLRDLNPAAVSAGLTAFASYTTNGAPLLIAVAGRLGLDDAHTSIRSSRNGPSSWPRPAGERRRSRALGESAFAV